MRRSTSTNFNFYSSRRSSVTTIDDWELAELLGVGGFGKVYRAVGRRGSGEWAGKEVAIKMIEKSKTATMPSLHHQIRKEVSIHWELSHPSVLSLYDYFEDSKNVYMVMEYCAGGELYRYLLKRASLYGHKGLAEISEPEARWLMKQLVEGLKYLHGLGILHRDLKLSNVLLTVNREIKLADFGLATKVSVLGGEQNTMCGTPNYISPEIVSRQPYGLASDVWSLGCMLVTFLTGKPPFENQEVRTTLQNVAKAKYTLPCNASTEARDLIHNLLQVNPADRPSLSDILNHPWFHTGSKILPLQDLSSFKDRILPPRRGGSRSGLARTGDERGVETEISSHSWKRRSFDKENIAPSSNQHASSQLGQSSRARSYAPEQKTFASNMSSSFDGNANQRLSTKRLKPMKQQTKHGTIEILQDGRVVVDFSDSVDVFVVSNDGEKIDLYERTIAISLSNPLGRWKRAYRFTDLPTGLVKKYRYAARFVQLLRSKTPKIIFYSPQAKCILMENHPSADFEMQFYNGIKVHNSIDSQELVIKVPSPTSSADLEVYRISTANITRVSVPSQLVNIFKQAQDSLRQCLEIERRIENERQDGEGKWPVVLKSSRYKEETRLGASQRLAEVEEFLASQAGSGGRGGGGGGGGEFTWIDQRTFVGGSMKPLDQSAGVVGHRMGEEGRQSRLRKVRSLPGGSFAEFRTDNARREHGSLARSTSTQLSMSTNTLSNARTFSTAPTSISSSPSQHNHQHRTQTEPSAPPTTPSNLLFYHMPEVGWCIKTSTDGRFTMCFLDGARVVVDARSQRVIYFGSSERAGARGNEFKIDRSLPAYVKDKLAYFPDFVKGFGPRVGMGTSESR